MEEYKWSTFVGFGGCPIKGVFKREAAARRAYVRAERGGINTNFCQLRLYACKTEEPARTADISEVRPGEMVIPL